MSLLASGWSRVYSAQIRGGTPGALVAVQNLVIAGSSGPVQHTALFFYSCMQSFHIMEVARKSRWKWSLVQERKFELAANTWPLVSVWMLLNMYFKTACTHAFKKLNKHVFVFVFNSAKISFSSGTFCIWLQPIFTRSHLNFIYIQGQFGVIFF